MAKANSKLLKAATQLDLVKLALLGMQRNSWEQGVTMDAFREQGDKDVVIALAKEAAYRCLPDGRLAMIRKDEGVTDPCSVGESLLWAGGKADDTALMDAAMKLLEWAVQGAPRNGGGIVYHVPTRPEFWVDSFYMLPPFLVAAGRPREALLQIYGWRNALYNEKAGLYSHIYDDGKKAFVREAFWGVGNGWAAAGLARVIALLPRGLEPERAELVEMEKSLLDALLRHAREDGLFHDVVDDTGTFVETNLSQMAAYAMYRGIADGWIPRESHYLADAERLRVAAYEKVDRFGLVQGVCGAPSFDKPGVAAEGQSFHLLMEAARGRVMKLVVSDNDKSGAGKTGRG